MAIKSGSVGDAMRGATRRVGTVPLPIFRLPRRVVTWVEVARQMHPLVWVRLLFGTLMLISTVRFVANGWVESLIIAPRFHFHYWGLQWVQPLPQPWMMYAVYGVMALCALGIALGAWYRWSVVGFLLTFTYTEVIDKAYYLNHYYFIILLALLFLLLPLNRIASIDAWRQNQTSSRFLSRTPPFPRWMLWVVRLQIGLVWCFAGIAKLNPDWLLHAQPLSMWLTARATYPLIGGLLDQPFTAFLMSWGGAAYDLAIPFLLLWPRTRRFGFLAALIFHALTAILFPTIGMFPYVMLACTLAFLPTPSEMKAEDSRQDAGVFDRPHTFRSSLATLFLLLFFAVQFFLPLRHWLYPGDVLWTEEGYRFSWRVMLVEKGGDVTFTLRDPATGAEWEVYPADYLTPQQEKQMAFQPDMIVEFAHFLAEEARFQGRPDVEVRAEAWVAFNGRPSRLLIDPDVDLAQQTWDLGHKAWILQ